MGRPRGEKQFMGTQERCFHGVIVTWVNEKGDLKVRHHPGLYTEKKTRIYDKRGRFVRWHRAVEAITATDALRDAVTLMERWPGTWKVQTISTPQSIYTDLTGARTNGKVMGPPEPFWLQRIGRIDLWAGEYASDREHYRIQRRKGRNGQDPGHDERTAGSNGRAAGRAGGRAAPVLSENG